MVVKKDSGNSFFLNKIFKGKSGQQKWTTRFGKKPPVKPLEDPRFFAKQRDQIKAKIPFRDFGSRQITRLRGGSGFILLSAVLWLLDMFALRYDGINVQRFIDNLTLNSGFESYIGWFFNSIVIALLVTYFVLYRPRTREFISWIFVAETISLILFMGGGGIMLAHLGIVLLFYMLYIRPPAKQEGGDIAIANYTFFALLFFDFFGYGILSYFINNPIVSNRFVIPLWFYFALIYTHERYESTPWTTFLIVLMVLLNIFYFMGGIEGLRNMSDFVSPEERQEATDFWQAGWTNLVSTFSKIRENIGRDFSERMEFATGGYYKGKVEKNKIGPLGVFINKIESSQPRYYPSESIVIWGTIKATSLGGKVNVKVNCLQKGTDAPATEIKPSKRFSIYSLENRDFECSFKPGSLYDPVYGPDIGDKTYGHDLFLSGTYGLKAEVEFNFETLAYLKSYFMDIERKRSMIREGLDPFIEYNIQDKNPVAIYTDGPIIIGMETTSPIIEVSSDYSTLIQPRIGITLENKEGWEGVIKKINEIVLLTPKGISIEDPAGDCSGIVFKDYDLSDCSKDDKPSYEGNSSCDKFVFKECVDVCINEKEPLKGYTDNKKEEAKKECIASSECTALYDNCKNDCKILFKGETDKESYQGYAIDTSRIDEEKFKDIERFRSFSCRLNVNKDLLGNTPLAVKYFRAKARYEYSIGKAIQIKVRPDPTVSDTKSLHGTQTIAVDGEVQQKIINYANQQNVPWYIALAIAQTESGFKHCCEGTDQNTGDLCKKTDATTCTEKNILKGPSNDLGIMQIVSKDLCNMNTEQLYNLDNNIKCGMIILKKKYDQYKDGCSDPVCETCANSGGKKYFEYKGWEAALRGYNGFGCGPGTNVDYVENIMSIAEKFKQQGLTESTTLMPPENVKIGSVFSGSIEHSKKENGVSAPWTDVLIKKGDKIKITWDKSPSQDQNLLVHYSLYKGDTLIKDIDVDSSKSSYEYTYAHTTEDEGEYKYYLVSMGKKYQEVGFVSERTKSEKSDEVKVNIIDLKPPEDLDYYPDDVYPGTDITIKWKNSNSRTYLYIKDPEDDSYGIIEEKARGYTSHLVKGSIFEVPEDEEQSIYGFQITSLRSTDFEQELESQPSQIDVVVKKKP